jgi:uncharacterized membrane protein YhhN
MILAVVLAIAVADWAAVALGKRRLEYVFKPATMLGVVFLTWTLTLGPHDAWQARWFFAAFGLSLAGDVFLMLPNQRLFVWGLAAFLLAHVCFVVGLNPTLPPAPAFVLLIPCALGVGVVLWRVIESLRAAGRVGLVAPVAAYGVAMTLMVFSAWATIFRPEWTEARRVRVIAGAMLFFVSDAILAWNRFVQPFAQAKLATIIPYHLGQIGLALSVGEG